MFLPLNTGYTAAEPSYFVDNGGASLTVADASKARDIGPIAARLGIRLTTLNTDGSGALADLARSQTDMFETVDRRGSDPAALLYTSGTTGRSKGAMPSQDNLLSNTIALCAYWQFTGRDLLLHALPIFHTHGLFVATHIALNAGGRTILPPKFDIDAMNDRLPEATSPMGVPTFYTHPMADDRFAHALVTHMRLFVSGSVPLSRTPISRLRRAPGTESSSGTA